jgi:precorrin-6A/cobalt-precorrin-6A reductase
MRVLILGGTTEAFALAQQLARDQRFAPTYSLAGRTAAPLTPNVPFRVGGFGGADGLAAWLAAEKIDVVVDATHPFAARISANAGLAAQRLRLPLLFVRRQAWRAETGDRWIDVADMDDAVTAPGTEPRRVFLAIGRTELGVFRRAPQHAYLVRAIDAPATDMLPPRTEVLLQRGPFELEDEIALLRSRAIDVLVSKNSGGDAAYAKIAAARALGLPVVMVRRPALPAGECRPDVASALEWLHALLPDTHGCSASERGV